MPRRKTRTLTELELEIMEVLWQRPEASVQDIQNAFTALRKPLAGATVRTMLSILQDKGYVDRRPEGKGFVYRAAVARAEAQKRILRDLVSRAFRGSATSLIAALLDSRMVSEDDLSRIEELVEKRKGEGDK